VAHNKISHELDRICLHLPHACIIIVENISKLDREAGGGFLCQSEAIGGNTKQSDVTHVQNANSDRFDKRKYFCILLCYAFCYIVNC
jgi:hypothetical protein